MPPLPPTPLAPPAPAVETGCWWAPVYDAHGSGQFYIEAGHVVEDLYFVCVNLPDVPPADVEQAWIDEGPGGDDELVY